MSALRSASHPFLVVSLLSKDIRPNYCVEDISVDSETLETEKGIRLDDLFGRGRLKKERQWHSRV